MRIGKKWRTVAPWLCEASRSAPRSSFRPRLQLEVLEDRMVPSSGLQDSSLAAAGASLTGFDLESIAQQIQAGDSSKGFAASGSLIQTQDKRILIDAIAANDTATLEADLVHLGIDVVAVNGRDVSGWAPLDQIAAINALPSMKFGRASAAPLANVGAVTTQGDHAQRSDLARTASGLTGAGVTVGALSDSYDTAPNSFTHIHAAQDVASGDLPSGVQVLQDHASGTDEGRAILQIVHDVAPGSPLAFATAYQSEAGFANNVLALKNTAGAKIIDDDVMYLDEPMFQDGMIAQAVDAVAAGGVAYFSSAGNEARQSYESDFRNGGTVAAGTYGAAFLGGTAHDFDPGPGVSLFQSITFPANSTTYLVLDWDSPWFSISGGSGSPNDMDIYLLNSSSTTLVGTVTSNDLNGDAVEILQFNPGATAQTDNLMLVNRAGPLPGHLKYVLFGSPTVNTFATNSSTIYGHANAAGAMAVGAARYTFTPGYGVSPASLEAFSSAGGTPIYFDTAGNRLASPVTRLKPGVVGPDGGDTTFFVPGSDFDGDGKPNFFGTSASAPHVAGIAALMLQANPNATPAQIFSALENTAQDMGTAGFDFNTGYGFALADAAVAAMASVTNVTSSTANGTYDPGASISIQITFNETVTVSGSPTLALNSGGSAVYSSGSGTNTLTFTYAVGSGQSSPDLDFASTSALSGSITVGGFAINMTLPTPGASGSLGANKDIVIVANFPPTLNTINPVAYNEDGPPQTVGLSGISAGPPTDSGQPLTVTALSSDTTLLPDPVVSYTSPNSTGSLTITAVANANGITTVTVIVNDGQSTNNTFTRTFSVTVNAINDPPTIDAPNPVLVNEDGPTQTVLLTGISAGPPNEVQPLTVTATSSNTAIFANPVVSYTSPNSTGRLTFTPITNANTAASGPVTVSVVVNDGQGSNNKTTQTFLVVIIAVNDAPTLSTPNPISLNEDATVQTVSLTGLTPGPSNEAGQPLIVTTSSSDTTIIPDPIISYTSPDTTGTLSFAPIATANTAAGGPVTITIIVNDGQGAINTVTRSFTVTIAAINDPPTLNMINSRTVNEDAAPLTLNLAGISAGPPNEAGQPLTVTATSSDPSIVPDPTIAYTRPGSSGKLAFAPVANANGTVTITVTINDSQGANNRVTRTFNINVTPINDPPSLNALNPISLNEDAAIKTVTLTGLSAGPPNESQALTVTADSSDPTVIPTPTVNYTSPDSSGTLTFTPVPDANGTATITVIANDGAGSNNLSTRTFTVTINAVNDPPTLDTPNPLFLNEDAAAQTVNLSGISAGPPNEVQSLIVTAVSSDPTIIPDPTVSYTSPDSTGNLTFTPVPDAYGTVTITVTVNDGAGTNNHVSRSFTVTVNPVNDPPTLNALNPGTMNEDGPAQTVALSGITAGPANETQTLVLTASSSDTSLIPNPTVGYAASGTTGSLTFAPAADANGTATITVTVNDGSGSNNTTTQTFVVTVNPVNDPPTLNALSSLFLVKDAALQTVNLSGIGAGAFNEVQNLVVTASSSDTTLLPNPTVSYTSANATGSLTFTPVGGMTGTALISVSVNDGGSSNNVITRTFLVNVTAS